MTDVCKTILVVEDDPFIALDTEDSLRALGFSVEGPFFSLKSALLNCEECDCDGALLDVNLGRGETSEPIAEVLRLRNIPIAFLSAYNPRRITFRLDSEPCLSKPTTQSSLEKVLALLFE